MILSTSQLVEACRAKNTRAQQQLYNTYYKMVYNSCYRIFSNALDAEDCMQESFIKAFEKLDTLGDAPIEAWLRRIAINTSIDYLKKRQIEVTDLNEQMYVVSEEEEENELEWQVEQIRKTMGTLPDKYRIVLSLHLFEGFDHQEIAEILNIEAPTVRTQYSRARQKLIEKLTHETRRIHQ